MCALRCVSLFACICMCVMGIGECVCVCVIIRKWMYVCMCVCVCVYVCIYVCVCVYLFTYVCLGVHMCVHGYTRMYVRVCMCTSECSVACYGDVDSFVWSELGNKRLDSIRICTRYGPDTLVIQRPTYEMIQRSILVRAVKTRRWFGCKNVSFNVSICFYVFLYLLLPVDVSASIRIISYYSIINFINMITCIPSWDINEYSPYLCN